MPIKWSLLHRQANVGVQDASQNLWWVRSDYGKGLKHRRNYRKTALFSSDPGPGKISDIGTIPNGKISLPQKRRKNLQSGLSTERCLDQRKLGA